MFWRDHDFGQEYDKPSDNVERGRQNSRLPKRKSGVFKGSELMQELANHDKEK